MAAWAPPEDTGGEITGYVTSVYNKNTLGGVINTVETVIADNETQWLAPDVPEDQMPLYFQV